MNTETLKALPLVCVLLCGCTSSAPKPNPVDCSQAKQDDRKRMLETLIETKLVKRFEVDGPSRVHLWATHYLLAKDFDAKANVCKLSFDYHACQSKSFSKIVLVDSGNGKRVGQYTRAGGLELD